jgi:hypothetical protein
MQMLMMTQPVMIIITSMHSQRATKLHQWNLNHPPRTEATRRTRPHSTGGVDLSHRYIRAQPAPPGSVKRNSQLGHHYIRAQPAPPGSVKRNFATRYSPVRGVTPIRAPSSRVVIESAPRSSEKVLVSSLRQLAHGSRPGQMAARTPICCANVSTPPKSHLGTVQPKSFGSIVVSFRKAYITARLWTRW